MRRPGTWTPAEIEAVKKLRLEGLSAHKIAERIGRSKTVTHGLVYELFGPTGAAVRGFASRWTPELDAQLRQMRWDGLTNAEIADRLGFSKGEVSKRAGKIGCPINPDLTIVKNKPLSAPFSEAQKRRANEKAKTPERRLHASIAHADNRAAPAGEFWHLISDQPWPGVHAHG